MDGWNRRMEFQKFQWLHLFSAPRHVCAISYSSCSCLQIPAAYAQSNERGRERSKWSLGILPVPDIHHCTGAIALWEPIQEFKKCIFTSLPYYFDRSNNYTLLVGTKTSYRLSRWFVGKESTAMQETRVQSRSQEDPMQKESGVATHSSILSGKSHGQRSLAAYSPWGLKRVGHSLMTKTTTIRHHIPWGIMNCHNTQCLCIYSHMNSMCQEWGAQNLTEKTSTKRINAQYLNSKQWYLINNNAMDTGQYGMNFLSINKLQIVGGNHRRK